ncbi:MAG: glutamate racemase [Clostridiales bacterium]|nr:glutamate racemase [Clostridiales bacterium]
MDQRPIGVFDSGLGGLTVLKELRKVLPGEDFIYFGDTGRVPYGSRSKETIIKYARQDMRFLKTFDVKAVLVACCTVSSLWNEIENEFDIPSVSVVAPSARHAVEETSNGKIGVIGTSATINSRAFRTEILKLQPNAEVFGIPCPLFVPLVENGRIRPGDVVIETVAKEYLEPFAEFGCDTLIMGCTHYPLLEPVISNIMPGVRLINVGVSSAIKLKHILSISGLLSDRGGNGSVDYFVSDDTGNFSELASMFLEQNISSSVRKVDIDKF